MRFYLQSSRITTALFFFFLTDAAGQTDQAVSTLLEQATEQTEPADENQTDYSELTDKLESYIVHPLNLNRVTDQDLLQSELFTPIEALAIIHHKQMFGDILNVAELQVVEGFELWRIREVLPYITVHNSPDDPNASFGRMVRDGEHTIIVRSQVIPEKKRGFADEDGARAYKGDPFGLYLRYRFSFMKKLSWCFVAEKDAGEKLWSHASSKGPDFYSSHIAFRNSGILKTAVAGDYQLAYAQGLTLNTGLSGGKGSDPAGIIKNPEGIKPYTSSNETNFKRGIALSVNNGKFILDGFISSRKTDGSLQVTDSSNSYFSSLQNSGYHRTDSEIKNKQSVREIFYGGRISCALKTFHAGITIHSTRFDVPLQENIRAYNRFDFNGTSLTNLGYDVRWLYRNFNFFGEFSVSDNNACAYLSGVVLSPDPSLVISILFRYYGIRYHNLNSSPFRESGNTSNERGIYGGLNFRCSRQVGIILNYDRFYFPWLKYTNDTPSEGNEFSITANYRPGRTAEFYVRCRVSEKQKNLTDGSFFSQPAPEVTRGIRLHAIVKVSKAFSLRARVESVKYSFGNEVSRGVVIFQDIQFHPMSLPVSWNMRYAYFVTDNYNSRVYAYENDVLYGYSIPAYYYNGSRVYVNTRIKLSGWLDVWLRFAVTFYSNRSSVGSGWDEIEGNRKSEVKLQARFTF